MKLNLHSKANSNASLARKISELSQAQKEIIRGLREKREKMVKKTAANVLKKIPDGTLKTMIKVNKSVSEEKNSVAKMLSVTNPEFEEIEVRLFVLVFKMIFGVNFL